MFTPNAIPIINTLQMSNRKRNDLVKSKVVVSVFPLSIK